jgi:hypothetical protein
MHGNRRLFDLATRNSQKLKLGVYIGRLPGPVADFMRNAQQVFRPEISVIAGDAISKAGRLHDGLLPVELHTQIMKTAAKCRAMSTLSTWIDALPSGTYLLVAGGGNGVRFNDQVMWVSELPGQYVALPDDIVHLHELIDSNVDELFIVAVDSTSGIVVEAVSGVLPEEPPLDREVVFELTCWGPRILEDRKS